MYAFAISKSFKQELYIDICWCTTQSRRYATYHGNKLEMMFFQVFFRDECTTYRGKFGHSMCGLTRLCTTHRGKQLEFTFHCTTLLRKFLLCKTVARQDLQNDRDIRLFIWPVRCILH